MIEKPSQKLTDLLKENIADPPVDPWTLPFEQRAVLSAYGRARTVRYLGREVALRDVIEHAQSDLPYGAVSRSRVPVVIKELIDLGFTFVIHDFNYDNVARRASKRREQTKATGAETSRNQSSSSSASVQAESISTPVKPARKRSSKTTELVPQLRRSADDPSVFELVGNVEPRTALVSAAVVKRSNANRRSEEPAGAGGESTEARKSRRRTGSC